MIRAFGVAGCVLTLLAGRAGAAEVNVPIDPASSRISYTVFVLGMVPVPATYDRFQGSLVLDAAHPHSCRVEVDIQVGSLHMDDPERTTRALAPDMLNAALYPTMHFDGVCVGDRAVGRLTLHGVTRPVSFTFERQGMTIQSTGVLRRRDWGIDGLALLVGQEIKLRLTVHVPPAAMPPLGIRPRGVRQAG